MCSFPSPRGFPNVAFNCNSSNVRLIVHVPACIVISSRKIVECFLFPLLSSCIVQLPCYVCSFVCIRRLPSKCTRTYCLCLIKMVVLIPFSFSFFFSVSHFCCCYASVACCLFLCFFVPVIYIG